MKVLPTIATALTLSSSLLFAAGEGWVTDFEAAKKQAAAENKSLLVDFTGSDWCGYCIKLDEEVFQQEAFQEYVADKFVLVELDFPRQTEISAELKEQNEALATAYEIQGFPTVILMDADGRPYARTGYQEGGAESYVVHLTELQGIKAQYASAIAAADELEGVAKAEGYLAALNLLPLEFSSFYEAEMEVIYANDPEDTTGFKSRMDLDAALMTLSQQVDTALAANDVDTATAAIDTFLQQDDLPAELKSSLQTNRLFIIVNAKVEAQDTDGAIAAIDAHIAANTDLEPIAQQELLGMKIDTYMNAEKFDEAGTVLEEIIALDPESEIAKMAVSFKSQLANHKEYAEAAKSADKKAEQEQE